MKQLFATILLIIVSITLVGLHAQEANGETELLQATEAKSPNIISKSKGLIQFVGHLLTDLDTVYIYPNKYKYALMLENSNWYEYYHFTSMDKNAQTLIFSPNINYKLGGYFGWKWIFVGYSIDLRGLFDKKAGEDQRTEFGLSLYSKVVGCDIYYRRSGNAFKLRNMADFLPDDYTGTIDKDIRGFSVNIKGLNAFWVFNHRKFSYPAAYSQSTNQLKSAGSWIAGLSYSDHNINFNRYKLPDHVQNSLSEAYDFNRIDYTDISASFGYSYNWVFAKNCLANLSLTPAIAFKRSDIKSDTREYPTHNHFNFDFITRAGVTYNNSKYFVGASLVMHTYEYRSDHFFLNNSFGTIRIYAGFNFSKKKEYRD